MKKHIFYISLMLLLSCWSCSDWDDHYGRNGENMQQSDRTVLEYLKGDPDYSDYLSLLESTGLDTIFDGVRLYTVFVAPNGRYGSFSSLNDSLKTLAVGNQITTGKYLESGLKDDLRLRAISKKMLRVRGASEDFSIEGSEIAGGMVNCKDGIIYRIDQPVAYRQTLWERIQSDPEYSFMVNLLEQELDTVFDRDLSRPTGYFDDENRPLYDSVFVSEPLMFGYGRINKDYEYYTVFLATNEQYEQKVAEYFANRTLITGFAPTKQDTLNLANWLRQSFIHRGLIDRYEEEETIYSAYGTAWRTNVQEIAGTPEECSNGYLYRLQDFTFPNRLLQNGSFSHNVSLTYDADQDSVVLEVTGEGIGDVTQNLERIRVSGITYYMYGKAELTAGYSEEFAPFDLSMSWVTGISDEETREFKPVYAAPGEYILRIQFYKIIEAAQAFDIYFHNNRVGQVELEEGSWDQINTYEVGLVVIPQSVGVQPLRIQLKNLGTGWQKALTPIGIELLPTSNNY